MFVNSTSLISRVGFGRVSAADFRVNVQNSRFPEPAENQAPKFA